MKYPFSKASAAADSPIARESARLTFVGLAEGQFFRQQHTRRQVPNEAAIVRLVGAILLEQNDEWAVQRSRYVSPETIAPLSDNPLVILPAVPAR